MRKILLLLLIVVMSGCTFQTKHRGYIFADDATTVLESVKTTAQLQDKFGSPAVKTMYGADTVWIYYGYDENFHGPLPLTYDNKTVLLATVRGNSVVDKKLLHDKDLPEVNMAEGETAIPAAVELSVIEELFNNIGRFSPAGLGQ